MSDPDIATLLRLAAEQDALLTPPQRLEVAIGRIRHYAFQHKLSAEQVEAIFDAGLAAASVLAPGRCGPDPTQAEAA